MSIIERLTFSGPSFTPDRDVPDLSAKVILVTGGNNGLGKETLLQLAKHKPAKLYMGARSEQKAKAAIAEIKKTVPQAQILFLQIDVSSFDSVKAAADTFIAQNDRLDVLINNAGIMGVEPETTKDGFEIHFGTNHLGPALLTKLLLPTLKTTSKTTGQPSRIINISSLLYSRAPKPGIPLENLATACKDEHSLELYAISKLANIYHAQELARRHPYVTSVSLHPGLVRTDIIGDHAKKQDAFIYWLVTIPGRLLSVDVPTGALTQLWASTAKDVENGGFYLPYGKLSGGTPQLEDRAAAARLWDWTEEQLRAHGY